MSWRRNLTKFMIRFGYRVLNQKVTALSQQLVGIDMGTAAAISGEAFVLKEIVLPRIGNRAVFDIGTNKGEYSAEVLRLNPSVEIYAFEPNEECIDDLSEIGFQRIFPIALSDKNGLSDFYTHRNVQSSAHGSLINHFEGNRDKKIIRKTVPVKRLDTLIAEEKIPLPGFMKIDTEGQDLRVIQGLGKNLSEIDFIQFEFNDMHVYSRIFLRDYYEHLHNYELYRIANNKLIDIREYSPYYEIFRFQNILCVNKALGLDLRKHL